MRYVVAKFSVEPLYPVGFVILEIILFLSIADVNIVTVVARSFCPDPHIRDILILCIAIKSALDISFEVNAVRACADRVVPTIHRCAT